MKTIIITDGKYRSSIAAVRTLGQAGYRVVVTQTRSDCPGEPPVFSSRYVSEHHWIEGSCRDEAYPHRLLEIIRRYEHPTLLCIGADSLNTVSREEYLFRDACDFLIAPPQVLDALNDKESVQRRGRELGIPVPKQYDRKPDQYPVIIKPHCGEKFGLKASERYVIAHNEAEYPSKLAAMQVYDPQPLVQECVKGDGAGACLLLDKDGRLISALCHRRVREYPITGGPSTCCVSFYDEEMIDQAYRLLRSFNFVGLAMVEFKGNALLEVNPRIWGSFPMTFCAESPFIANYAAAAAGETVEYKAKDYKTDVKMRFVLNDTIATLHYLKHGKLKTAFTGMLDVFRAKEALACKDDPQPLRKYISSSLMRK